MPNYDYYNFRNPTFNGRVTNAFIDDYQDRIMKIKLIKNSLVTDVPTFAYSLVGNNILEVHYYNSTYTTLYCLYCLSQIVGCLDSGATQRGNSIIGSINAGSLYEFKTGPIWNRVTHNQARNCNDYVGCIR